MRKEIMKKPNYTYVECARCNRKGTPRCRRKGKRWGSCVIPGCMELVENAPRFIEVDGKRTRQMSNLYDETEKLLIEHGKAIADIAFVSGNGHEIPLDNFLKIAKDFSYDDGYGSAEVPLDLLIVGKDWWMERHEYDGSEWWEYKTLPCRPDAVRSIAGIGTWGEYIYGEGGAS